MGQTNCCCGEDGGNMAGVVKAEPLINSEFAERERPNTQEVKILPPVAAEPFKEEAPRTAAVVEQKANQEPILPLPEDISDDKAR
eukprot:4378083-Amphidinium_carterae.1